MCMFVTWLIQLTVLNQQSPNIVSELAKENLQLQLIQRTVAAFILLCFNMGELSCNVSDGGMGWGRRPEMVLEKMLANLRYFLFILDIEQAFLTLQITIVEKFYQTSRYLNIIRINPLLYLLYANSKTLQNCSRLKDTENMVVGKKVNTWSLTCFQELANIEDHHMCLRHF